MTTNLETLKADYLAEFNRAVPKLKSLATAIRKHESQLTTDEQIDDFWAISGDRQTDYQLCQVAADLDGLDEFWATHPNNLKGSDQAPIAVNAPPTRYKNKELLDNVMALYSLSAILSTAFEALPQVGPDNIINAGECVRYCADLLSQEAGKIEKLTF